MARRRDMGSSKPGVVGFLDRIDEAGLGGWAVDFARPAAGLQIRVLIDDVLVELVRCDLQRDDAKLLNLQVSRIGFYYNIPARYHDGLRHVLRFATLDGRPLEMSSRQGTTAQVQFCLAKPVRIEGMVDGVSDGLIQGWALRVDERAKRKTGGARVLVTLRGEPVAELVADLYRADVASATNGEANCGFAYAPPAELQMQRRNEFRFLVMPEQQELAGSPVEVVYPDPEGRDRIAGLIARIDGLFSLAYHLKRDLQALVPAERYLLSDYARWAARSMPLALARARARYGVLPECSPLVSILCPVYRPNLPAFLQMLDSVRRQSYPHWELLLVDDGSNDAALGHVLQAVATAEPRCKLIVLPENAGISAASNAGLRQAEGRFVALLDHDDVLEPVALEIMLLAQAASGARLLYSDEDKIDAAGELSEPHLKSEFNLRLLRELNYICHFVMVEAKLLREVGGFDSRFDGAQDHDLLLRLTESLPAGQIQHVPEILYHWRKSASSTAGAGSGAKPLAARAGARAVTAHLQRCGLPGKAVSREGLTCYRVDWQPSRAARQQAKVSILIPFRDQIEMTAECVAAIRRHTRDVSYEIILLDNWSTAPEAEAFLTAQANLADTKVIRIAEPFNYSRINNIGVAESSHAFLLFLNNDVFVRNGQWLRRMLDECLVNANVSAVGVKLLYPNDTVQHAGVVLGVGGVADHAFRGIGREAPGYVMRAMVAQRVSAVTGACMLVRRGAFEAVQGFDEVALAIAFNDIDLCMKLASAGGEIVFLADVVAEHRESMSRGDDFSEAKIARFMDENEVMKQRYAERLPCDPFYNPHFSREGGVYRELRLLQPGD
jgi:GT2 family glycosyltransferase